MSLSISSWVWSQSSAKGLDKLVLLAIADFADDDGGNAWPSISTLADRCGVTRRSVIRCLDRLTESGELRVTQRGGRSARGGRSNRYQVVTHGHQSDPPSGDTESPVGEGKEVTHGHHLVTQVVTQSPSSGDTESPDPSLIHPSTLISQPTHTGGDSQSDLDEKSIDLDQETNRAVGIWAKQRANALATTNPDGYAATAGAAAATDGTRDRLRDLIAEGSSAEEAAAQLATVTPISSAPSAPVDEATQAEILERAHRRIAEGNARRDADANAPRADPAVAKQLIDQIRASRRAPDPEPQEARA